MATAGWDTGELLGFDLETTGVERHLDVPVSFALVAMRAGRVVWRLTRLVDPGRPIPAAATAVHGITTDRARRDGMALAQALGLLTDVLVATSRRGVPLVGMNLSYDLTMLDHQLRSLTGSGLGEAGWCGPVLDVLVLDRHLDRSRDGTRQLSNLCAHYAVELAAAHDAGADAEAALAVLLALCQRFPLLAATDLGALTEQQTGWHRDWVDHVDASRRSRGSEGLAPAERIWPVSPTPAAIAGAAGLAAPA